MPQFDLSAFPGQIFWVVLLFALQYLIMQRFVLPGLRSIFHKRNSYIEQRLKLAEDQTIASEKMHANYEDKMSETKKIHTNLINEAMARAHQHVENTLEDLDKKLSDELYYKEARKSLASSAKAIEDMSVGLAIDFINKVGGHRVTRNDLLKYMQKH